MKESAFEIMHEVVGMRGPVMGVVKVPRPTHKPEHCGRSNEDLECLGCGEKLGCIKPGHCYAVEGKAALESSQV